jgi:hypothetical protein
MVVGRFNLAVKEMAISKLIVFTHLIYATLFISHVFKPYSYSEFR